MSKARVKDILTVEIRVSLFQTCINNAKGRTSRIIMDHAKEMYAIALDDIKEFGGIEVNKLSELVDKQSPQCRVSARKASKLLARIYKQQKKGKR